MSDGEAMRYAIATAIAKAKDEWAFGVSHAETEIGAITDAVITAIRKEKERQATDRDAKAAAFDAFIADCDEQITMGHNNEPLTHKAHRAIALARLHEIRQRLNLKPNQEGIDPTDIRIDVYQAGFGLTATRMTHLPTGIVVHSDDGSSIEQRHHCMAALQRRLPLIPDSETDT